MRREANELRKLLLVLLIPLGLLAWWAAQVRSRPPQVPFARVTRETLVSTLPTNGKVEPVEWSAVRAEAEGLVRTVPVHEGQTVDKGAVLATLSETGLAADIAAAQARVAQANAELASVEAGGKNAELADIQNELAKARFDRDAAEREYGLPAPPGREAGRHAGRSGRGAPENAGSGPEYPGPRTAPRGAGGEDGPAGCARPAARCRGRAGGSPRQVRRNGRPRSAGGYGLRTDSAARRLPEAGRTGGRRRNIDQLRVRVYVDEPELGRVEVGQPVTITWDALPGKAVGRHRRGLPPR